MRESRHGQRAFSLIEMLVVLVVIMILVGIGLTIGREVFNTSRVELTRSELQDLKGSEQSLEHETAGAYPDSMYDFLVEYQRMHAYKDANGVWRMRANLLTELPASMVKSVSVSMPGNTSMYMVTEVNDAWGNAIQFINPFLQGTPMAGAHGPYFLSAGEDGVINTADDIHSYDP